MLGCWSVPDISCDGFRDLAGTVRTGEGSALAPTQAASCQVRQNFADGHIFSLKSSSASLVWPHHVLLMAIVCREGWRLLKASSIACFLSRS